MEPPLAPRRPTVVERGRVDDWYWLRDRNDPLTVAHLEAENAYTAAAMADTEPDRHLAAHHEVDTYKALCRIAFRKGDWPALAGWHYGADWIATQGRAGSTFLLWRPWPTASR